jgi:energy-coupling factor transporter ATP-binding protein EcfA2
VLKLKNLHIKRFRNVKPGTRLDFADGFNVLLGKNGAGKTTLLRLLEAISVSSFAPFKDEAFDLDYEWAGDEGRISVHVENVRREQLGEATPALRLLDRAPITSEHASQLRVDIAALDADGYFETMIETTNGRTTVARQGQRAELSGAAVFPTGNDFFFALASGLATTVDSAVLMLSEHTARGDAFRFDESLGYYTHIKTRQFVDLSPMPPTEFGAPGWVSVEEDTKTPRHGAAMSFDASDVPFLAMFIRALGSIRAAELQLSIASKDTKGVSLYGDLRVWLTRLDGSGYSDDKLSYGQKRLFSFLYYLAANRHTVIADELVNGLHHDWIDLCVNEIGARQAFLTSQNPLLMDHLSFETNEDVRRAFVLCQLAYEGDSEVLIWRNMTPDEAGAVFEAGEVGIEHLSTILRNEGLW